MERFCIWCFTKLRKHQRMGNILDILKRHHLEPTSWNQKKWFPFVERMRTHPNWMDRSLIHLQAKAGSERCLANWNTSRCSCSQKSPLKRNPWRMETFPFHDFEASSRKKWCLSSNLIGTNAYRPTVGICQSMSRLIYIPFIPFPNAWCEHIWQLMSQHRGLHPFVPLHAERPVTLEVVATGCWTNGSWKGAALWRFVSSYWGGPYMAIFVVSSISVLYILKKCTWHVINIYTEISMNGHLEGKIWTSINIPTYPFHPTSNFKLDLFCVGFICRILNSAEYTQKVIAGERWMCGLNFGIDVYHRYYIFEPIKHNKRKYTLPIVICACKSTVKALDFFLCLERRSTAVQHWWFGNKLAWLHE